MSILKRPGNDRFLAVVENNIARVFCNLERFDEAHEHLDRAIAVVMKLADKGLRAQFEDTRARIFLSQGRADQAEKIARAAVTSLRDGDQQSNLVAALTTLATAQARMGQQAVALTMLREAVSLAGQVGDSRAAALPRSRSSKNWHPSCHQQRLIRYYKNAESALAQSQQGAIKFRVGECARVVLAREDGTGFSSERSTPETPVAAASLEEQVLRFEGELIKQALQVSDGSVTRAARLLGVTHQGWLSFSMAGKEFAAVA